MNATNGDYLHLYKRYVDVVTVIKKNGQMLPLYLAWDDENGRKLYRIDKVHQIKKAVSEVGGCGVRYDVRIAGHERRLFYEKDRWFIESHQP
ncbi:hypothetical protein [Sharpea azabuensis]|uniref:hypothetical protein n=1 Tax=Sharpea azabuensis TaxID=322505 RepID=UPI00051C6BDC|nr:hypothetical protein [Sharpea azabuensis]